MDQQFRFNTRRLLLTTAALAVWVAVLVNGNQKLGRIKQIPPQYEWIVVLTFFVVPTLLLTWLAAVIVRTLARKSILAACCGLVAYVAFIVFLSRAGWL
jgi:hypothetical protein